MIYKAAFPVQLTSRTGVIESLRSASGSVRSLVIATRCFEVFVFWPINFLPRSPDTP